MRDFFISYNSEDRLWAEWIAWILEEAGYSVFIQSWDFRPGADFVREMHKAADQTEKTIAVLSENYLRAEFTQSEWAAAFAKDPTGDAQKLVPVRVGECKPTGMHRTRVYVDLVGLSESDARTALLGAFSERAKPAEVPDFPSRETALANERCAKEKGDFPGASQAINIADLLGLESELPVESERQAMPAEQRLELMRRLNGVAAQQFNMLLFALNPLAGLIPPMPAPQGDRASALLSWAESEGGCGLGAVVDLLGKIIGPKASPPHASAAPGQPPPVATGTGPVPPAVAPVPPASLPDAPPKESQQPRENFLRRAAFATKSFWDHFWNRTSVEPMPGAGLGVKSITLTVVAFLCMGWQYFALFSQWHWVVKYMLPFATWLGSCLVFGYVIVKHEADGADRYAHRPFSRFIAKFYVVVQVAYPFVVLFVFLRCVFDAEPIVEYSVRAVSAAAKQELETKRVDLDDYVDQEKDAYRFLVRRYRFRERCGKKPPKSVTVTISARRADSTLRLAWADPLVRAGKPKVTETAGGFGKPYSYRVDNIVAPAEILFHVLMVRQGSQTAPEPEDVDFILRP